MSSPSRKKFKSAKDFPINLPFCLIHKRDDPEKVILFRGQIEELDNLNDVPLPQPSVGSTATKCENGYCYRSISVLPFSQVSERGFYAVNEGEKIKSIRIESAQTYTREEIYEVLPPLSTKFEVGEIEYEMDQKAYEKIVQDIIDKEIKNGEGSSFVTPRPRYC